MADDVTFTYMSGGREVQKVLKWNDPTRKDSREAIAIWKVDGNAWKVYSTTAKYQAIQQDYDRADAYATLTMGKPKFQQGSVLWKGKTTQGFVLSTYWSNGKFFQVAKARGAFKAALTQQNIPHNKSAADYQR